jgi:Major tropism determinant N-terminal domain
MTVANINVRQVLLKRGNTAVSSTYTGPIGEITVDTTLYAVRVHDGVTPGGFLLSNSTVSAYLSNGITSNIVTSGLGKFSQLTTTSDVVVGGNLSVVGTTLFSNTEIVVSTEYISGNITANSGTISIGPTTGALVITGTGGAGIGGNLNVAGTITGNINSSIANIGSTTVNNTLTAGTINAATIGNTGATITGTTGSFAGTISTLLATNATGLQSGALQVTAGGASIQQDLWVGGNIYANVLNTVSTQILQVNDPLLYLFASNLGSYNYEIGFYSHFVGGSTNNYQHTGLARNHNDGNWYLFSNVSEPTGNTINLSNANLVLDPIKLGSANIANTTVSTSTTTGALVVSGGVGLGGNLNVGGNIITTANILSPNYLYSNGVNILNSVNSSIQTLSANVGTYEIYANANIGAYQTYANSQISTISANLGAFEIYANANIGAYQTYANSQISTISANLGAFEIYANANIGAYQTYANSQISTISANLGAFEIYANANIGAYQTYANSQISTISANLGAFESYANTKIGTSPGSNLVVVAATAATSTTTGALVIPTGGLGIGGNLYVGSNTITAGGKINTNYTYNVLINNQNFYANILYNTLFFDTASSATISNAWVALPAGASDGRELTLSFLAPITTLWINNGNVSIVKYSANNIASSGNVVLKFTYSTAQSNWLRSA